MKKKQLIWKVKKITYRYKEQLYIDVENINYNGFEMGICLHQCIILLSPWPIIRAQNQKNKIKFMRQTKYSCLTNYRNT